MKNVKLTTGLFAAIKGIEVSKLSEPDKEDLLRFFLVAENPVVRDRIAIILSEAGYQKSVPHILKRIFEPKSFNKNGTLVYALEGLNVTKHYLQIIKILCEMGYEARVGAYTIIEKLNNTISKSTRYRALALLTEKEKTLIKHAKDRGEDSALHFVQATIRRLRSV